MYIFVNRAPFGIFGKIVENVERKRREAGQLMEHTVAGRNRAALHFHTIETITNSVFATLVVHQPDSLRGSSGLIVRARDVVTHELHLHVAVQLTETHRIGVFHTLGLFKDIQITLRVVAVVYRSPYGEVLARREQLGITDCGVLVVIRTHDLRVLEYLDKIGQVRLRHHILPKGGRSAFGDDHIEMVVAACCRPPDDKRRRQHHAPDLAIFISLHSYFCISMFVYQMSSSF